MPVIHVCVGFDPEHSLRTNKSKRFEGFEQSGAMMLGASDTEFCAEVKPRQISSWNQLFATLPTQVLRRTSLRIAARVSISKCTTLW